MHGCMHACMYVRTYVCSMYVMYVDHVSTIFTNVVPGLLRGTAYSPWIPKSSACHESQLCYVGRFGSFLLLVFSGTNP